MNTTDRYNLTRVLRPCGPWADGLDCKRVASRGEYRVEQFSHGGLQAYRVSGPAGVQWFELDPADVMTAVLGVGTSLVSGESGGQASRRRCIETRLGVSVEEYERRVANGNKICSRCREWLPFIGFALNRGRPLGLNAYCKECDRKNGEKARAARGLPPRKGHRPRGRHYNHRDTSMTHASTADGVFVDGIAPGARKLLAIQRATIKPEGMGWRISLPVQVRLMETSRGCGIFRFNDGAALLVDRSLGKLVASIINMKGKE